MSNNLNLDTNISNYSLSELMVIINVDDLEPERILENTNYFIDKYKIKNPKISVFFKEIQSQLLQYSQDLKTDNNENEDDEDEDAEIIVETGLEGFGNMSNEAVYPSGDKQVTKWYTNEALKQNDQNQQDKITDRKQKIKVFGNQHVPMNREQISTTDTYNLPVKQDSLNPNLKNTINRFINLDSQFRQYSSGNNSSTDYTCDLSDTLKNTLKLSLYSYQIPFSWYTIDTAYGNTCLWISDPKSGIIVEVSVPPGNYSQTEFQTQLNKSFSDSGFSFTDGVTIPVNYNSNNGKISLYLYGAIYDGGSLDSFTVTSETQIIFFDFNSNLQCSVNCYSKSNHYLNNTLGWIMGYRLPYLNVDPSGNHAGSILDLNGTKYLIISIDDYNQNHVNNSLVSISQFSNTLKIPSYYSPDLPYTCINSSEVNQTNNLSGLVTDVVTQSLFDNQTPNTQNGLLIASKYEKDYTNTQIVLPSAPRTLTNAQLYTINSINNNNNNLTNYLSKAPTTSDILAIIPVKTSVGLSTGSLLVEFSGSLQDNQRTYFGPVNIERMNIKLLDDKGNILNLNGNDWCITLIAECLYQY